MCTMTKAYDVSFNMEWVRETQLNWTSEAEEHFDALKIAITCTPALGLPDYSRPFHLHAGEAVGVAMGVLTQEHGGKPCPVSYLSRQLDLIVLCMPACLRAVATAAEMVRLAEKIVLSYPLILYATHQVGVVLQNLKTQYMTAQRWSGYEATLLATESVTIKLLILQFNRCMAYPQRWKVTNYIYSRYCN